MSAIAKRTHKFAVLLIFLLLSGITAPALGIYANKYGPQWLTTLALAIHLLGLAIFLNWLRTRRDGLARADTATSENPSEQLPTAVRHRRS